MLEETPLRETHTTRSSSDSRAVLSGKSILVTGGAGSFGKAFVRRALDQGAKRVAILSRDEYKHAQMRDEFNDPRLRFFIGSVTDRERVALAMQGVELVAHAAAMKRIEVCEENPWEAVQINVVGTHIVAQEAIRARVSRAVFLSTDKSPAAHTLYGSTKFTAERLWVQSNVYVGKGPTRLSATRYGNVLGSRGSVLDIFRTQHSSGEKLTVTDRNCSRFWMTIDQAVDLVALAFREMRGGEIFVPKVPSASILTLARAVAPDSPVSELGLRGAERIHETLISPDEAATTCDWGTHYRIEPESVSWGRPHINLDFVPADFSYRSDTNPDQLSVEGMRELIAA